MVLKETGTGLELELELNQCMNKVFVGQRTLDKLEGKSVELL